jgi:hypothetical protein
MQPSGIMAGLQLSRCRPIGGDQGGGEEDDDDEKDAQANKGIRRKNRRA